MIGDMYSVDPALRLRHDAIRTRLTKAARHHGLDAHTRVETTGANHIITFHPVDKRPWLCQPFTGPTLHDAATLALEWLGTEHQETQ